MYIPIRIRCYFHFFVDREVLVVNCQIRGEIAFLHVTVLVLPINCFPILVERCQGPYSNIDRFAIRFQCTAKFCTGSNFT